MSTRATIAFYENDELLVRLYHHFDGYISGLGYDIADWLKKKRVGNGIGADVDENFANGVGCLVAQFIRDFKTGVGNLYVLPADNLETEDYNYEIYITTDYSETYNCDEITTIKVTEWDNEEPIFVGTPTELRKENAEQIYEIYGLKESE